MRKMVQVAGVGGWLYVLADDGTLWRFVTGEFRWEQVMELPQPEVAK